MRRSIWRTNRKEKSAWKTEIEEKEVDNPFEKAPV